MSLSWVGPGIAAAPLLVAVLAACASSKSTDCGPGTRRSGNLCLVASDGGTEHDADIAFDGVAEVAPASTTSLLVTWKDAHSTVAGEHLRYAIFFAESGAAVDWTRPVAIAPAGARVFYLTGLDPGKTYDVGARALRDDGRTDGNVVVRSGRPAADPTPPAFGGVRTAEPAGSGAVRLEWGPAEDGATPAGAITYLVYGGDTASLDLAVPKLVTEPGATSAIVTGLDDGAAVYRFLVRARDAADNVDQNEVRVTARAGADTTPPTFGGCAAAVADSAGSAVVSWERAIDDASPPSRVYYDVFAAADGQEIAADGEPAATVVNETSARISGLTSDKAWRFLCRARDFSGNRDGNTVQRVARTLLDSVPPSFAGISGAKVDGLARSVVLSWAPGDDDKTPRAELIYDVYEAPAPGAQRFDLAPRASSAAGAAGVTIGDLTPDTTLYWVVRARDQGNNRDANVVEASGAISVSFARQVQPIFTRDCAVSGCHVPGNPMAGLPLSPGFAYGALVNVRSLQVDDDRVAPGDPATSYLYKKIVQNPPPVGWQMPAPATGSVLAADEMDIVKRWILQGAVNN